MPLHATTMVVAPCRPGLARDNRMTGHSTAHRLAVNAARLATIDGLAPNRLAAVHQETDDEDDDSSTERCTA